MTELVAGLFGVGVGLAFALFANMAVLPRVLEAQRQTHAQRESAGGSGGDIARLTRITTLAYRLAFPVVCGVVGYDLGTRLWGLMQ
ncbi:hypothetical protein [Blastochloris sulfoviridis]|uniref:Uncharacterized protein n=1 Tax=Blastochloris sulfoviridis TaxID=50712 RepID=A0A5M6HYZ1_9HYPH|nr:hypothetical protein [Blastochloris sulfoviridis]KAA5601133.1 hypothetical protein F1193_10010 [Blastochloris sulfoviridis]